MRSLFRTLQILHVIGYFRLDILMLEQNIPWRYRLFLLPYKLYPAATKSRAERLRFALEKLGPIFVEFGQILSTRPDLFPADIIAELNYLQDKVTPFNNEEFKTIVEDSLGDDVENIFKSYSKEPLASASVAQVHCAVLPCGRDVIIKVIRPQIKKTIEMDIALLTVIASFIEKYTKDGKRLKPVEVVENYRETILDELDLAKEAANASQLRRNFESSNELYIPEIHWDYTRNNVMVMERIYGTPVTDIDTLKKNNTNLKLLAERGVNIFFTQVFTHNFFHADMHPGNVFVANGNPETPSYIAVDMAIIGSLTREDQYYLARNLLAMFRRDYRLVAELHVLSGWVPKGTSISSFESAIRSVCEPIFEKPLKDISFGHALISLFKTAQRFDMPVQPQLVLLQKTLVNIEGLGRQLYPDLDLWATAHPFLEQWIKERFHPKTLMKELKYHAPEWMEKFPQLPHLIFDTINESKKAATEISDLKHTLISDKTSRKNTSTLKKVGLILIVLALCVGNYSAWPTRFEFTKDELLLGSTLITVILLYLL